MAEQRAASVSMRFSFDELQAQVDRASDGRSYVQLGLKSAVGVGTEGSPELPCIRRLVALPLGATPTVRVLRHNTQEVQLHEHRINALVRPVQPPQSKSQTPSNDKFTINHAIYSTNAYLLSEELASVRVLGNMRGISVALLEVRAVNYNPVDNKLLIHNNIDIVIDYRPPTAIALHEAARTASPYFDALYAPMAGAAALGIASTTAPVRMLVVAHRMFEQALLPFVRWKRQKGFEVEVAYTDRIGRTPTDIKHYIRDVYNAATPQHPAPTFLVLVGDVEQVPASGMGSETERCTDLYYACIDDDDHLPELLYGRISAQTIEQLQHIVDKVLLYEQYAFANPSYLNRATLIAGEDDFWNPLLGQPSLRYATRHYFNPNQGYTTVNEYGVDYDPSNSTAQAHYNGCYGPEQLAVGYINYTAHGLETAWLSPALNAASVLSSTNTQAYPLVVANCCLSADFGYANDECLGETWLRAPQRGAVAYIGSAPNTYWYNDAYWAMGAFDAAETGTGTTFDRSTMGAYDAPFHSDYVSTAGIMFAGNLAVTQAENSGYILHKPSLFQWQAYNVLGDPSLVPHFTEGKPMDVRHPHRIALGQRTLTVQAPEGAYVALSLDTVLLDAAMADRSGMVHLIVPPHIGERQLQLVATKPQHIPHLALVCIAPPQGAALLANGPLGQAISGTAFKATVELTNVGTSPSTTASATLLGHDAHMRCTSPGPHPLPSIGPGDTVRLDNLFAFALSDNVPDQHRAWFDLALQTDDTTWTTRVWVDVQAPKLKVLCMSMTHDDNDNEVLDVGEGAQITVLVRNEGHAAAPNAYIELRSLHEHLQIIDPERQTAAIGPDSTAELHFGILALPSIAEGTTMYLEAHAAQGRYADSARMVLSAGLGPTAQVGTGQHRSTAYPFYNYRQLGRTQLLLLRHEVAPAPRQITQLGLHIAEVGQLPTLNNLTISIVETDAEALGPNFADTTGRTVVFSSAVFTLPSDTSWLMFDLGPQGFDYSGLRNLLIEIGYGPNASTSMHDYYAVECSHTPFASVVHGVGDLNMPMGLGNSTTLRPNVRLQLSTPAAASHSVSFELLDEQMRPLPNTLVRLGTAQKRTNTQGQARFGAVLPQRYAYHIEHSHHVPAQGLLGPRTTDTTIRLTLDRYNLLRFSVADTAAPIAGATLHIAGTDYRTDANGMALVRLGDGDYPYSISMAHHTTVSSSISVLNDTLDVAVQLLPHPRRWLTIALSDDEGQPVPNAAVAIDNQIFTTNEQGEARLRLFGNETYSYSIEHQLFAPSDGSHALGDENATLSIGLQRLRTVRFSVSDGEHPVAGVTVQLSGLEAYTDNAGMATFSPTNGRYTYTLSKHGFVGLARQPISIKGDTLVHCTINRRNILIFNIIDSTNGNPIADAMLLVNGALLSTDQNGRTQLRLVNDTYAYTVQHLAYRAHTGQVVLSNADAEVEVRMSPLSSSASAPSNGALRLHPNPTSGELWVEATEAEVVVFSTSGRLVLRKPSTAGRTRLDMTHLPAGVYIVRSGSAVARLVRI